MEARKMKRITYLFLFLFLVLFVLAGCGGSSGGGGGSSTDPTTETEDTDDSGGGSGGSGSSSLSDSIISSLSSEMTSQSYSNSQVSKVSSDAQNYLSQQGLSSSTDVSQIGNSILYSLENISLASSSIVWTPADKIRAIEIANSVFVQYIDANSSNIVVSGSNTPLSPTSSFIVLNNTQNTVNPSASSLSVSDVYSYATKGFASHSISYLDEAGIDADNVYLASQGILISIFSKLADCNISQNDIPQVLKSTMTGVVSTIRQSGVSDAQIPYIMNKTIVGAMSGASNLNYGDDWIVSVTDDLLEGTMTGFTNAGINGELLELSVTGLKTGLDDGLGSVAHLNATQKSQFMSDIGNQNALAAFNPNKKTIEILVSQTDIPIGARYPVRVNANYYASNQNTDLTSSCTLSTSANLNITSGQVTASSTGSGIITAVCPEETITLAVNGVDAAIVSLAIDPIVSSLPKGKQHKFNAIATYTDDTTADVSVGSEWSASLSENFTLSSSGLFSGSNVGDSVMLTAINGGFSDSIQFSISAAVVDYLSITPLNASVPKGKTQQYALKEVYTDGIELPVSSGITWTNASATGLATGSVQGDMTISAERNGMSASVTLTVTQKEMESLVISPEKTIITLGNSQQFSATGVYTDGTTVDKTSNVKWSVNYLSLAFIIDYRTTATPNGLLSTSFSTLTCNPFCSTYVFALCDSNCEEHIYNASTLEKQTSIHVSKYPLSSIALSPSSPTIDVDETQQISATATFDDGTNSSTADVTWQCSWSSSNANVYAYPPISYGLVRGDSVGSATITADCWNNSVTATVTVE